MTDEEYLSKCKEIRGWHEIWRNIHSYVGVENIERGLKNPRRYIVLSPHNEWWIGIWHTIDNGTEAVKWFDPNDLYPTKELAMYRKFNKDIRKNFS